MLKKVAIKITKKLVKFQIISEADSEIYEFGFETGFVLIINVVLTASIGLILGMLLESLALLFVFIPLRSCAGGIHTSNNIKCLLLSAVSVLFVLIGAKLIQDPFIMMLLLLFGVISALLIYVLAPIQDSNKPLSKEESRKLKSQTLKVLCMEICPFIGFYYFSLITFFSVMALTLCLVCLSVCSGAIKNYLKATFL